MPGRAFFPQSVKIITFAAAPLVLTPICPQPRDGKDRDRTERLIQSKAIQGNAWECSSQRPRTVAQAKHEHNHHLTLWSLQSYPCVCWCPSTRYTIASLFQASYAWFAPNTRLSAFECLSSHCVRTAFDRGICAFGAQTNKHTQEKRRRTNGQQRDQPHQTKQVWKPVPFRFENNKQQYN